MSNKDIATLLESRGCDFSLQDKLVLAIPKRVTTPFIYKSIYSNLNILIERQAIFICQENEWNALDKSNWKLYSMDLSELVEILAVIDTAMGQAFLAKKKKLEADENNNNEYIELIEDFSLMVSIKNVVIDLIIRNHPVFDSWCEILRRYEAYGMMRFILSSAQENKNANINQLCAHYGISASYFRQLYRENFNKTAKRKIMSVRMANAILQLIESDDSILDVGLEAGYCSASHFTNDIKKELGLTPSEIRHIGATLYEQ
ncbi:MULTISPECIES: helix-turn-helix domain-containing protein [Providencia]|uniref:helix-turn-helix domain-containing protein n=1 Tax=Providencia TaxID=586 RepID=UPI000D7E4656|nr:MULTISPECIES: AraC family transcriptional regulator [Providencia]AWS49785.1 AraC family transcriptional regulator [Providencia rettgeri]MCG5292646.1 AraC family transcriptional regulator [Providencia rettgeri]WOB82252.1 AraC family transcriptional regulator [Providencia sp. PROV114]HEM6857891.1 AraC family transcriptional regulator [Providencia rettgeri]